MTRQEALNLNWNHFVVNQKPKCVTQDEYRNYLFYDPVTQNCCAVGLLFGPGLRQVVENRLVVVEELSSELEDMVEEELAKPEHLDEVNLLIKDLSLPFLTDLQETHDLVVDCQILIDSNPIHYGTVPVQFQRRLTALARRYDLTCPLHD